MERCQDTAVPQEGANWNQVTGGMQRDIFCHVDLEALCLYTTALTQPKSWILTRIRGPRYIYPQLTFGSHGN